MPIHFISGKPRGGKSLYAVKLIVDELVYGTRPVFTNVPLVLSELNSYLQKQFPDKSVNLFERVRLLTDDEAAKFWCYRPHGVEILCLSKEDWAKGKRPDYVGVIDDGVFYAIDEVHNFFNSRNWMETGRDVLYYLSQHAKLGDTVLAITQHVGNVDKQFRSVTQDYTYLRNLAKERMGVFKMPGVFLRKTYLQPATDTSKPMETGTFRLDVSGLAACYNTAVGVGIHGRQADKLEKKKGLSWVWFAVGVPIVVMIALHYGPRALANAFSPKSMMALGAGSTGKPEVPTVGKEYPVPQSVQRAMTNAGVVAPELLRSNFSAIVPAELFVTGYSIFGSNLIFTLSDGRVVRSPRDVDFISQDSIHIRNEGFAKIKRGTL